MRTLFSVLVLASTFVIIFNFIWTLSPSNRKNVYRPFLWFEWIAFLVGASIFVFMARDGAPWIFIIAAICYIASISSYRDWHKWLDHKAAVPNETD